MAMASEIDREKKYNSMAALNRCDTPMSAGAVPLVRLGRVLARNTIYPPRKSNCFSMDNRVQPWTEPE